MFGQPDHSLHVCEMDVRVGGELRFIWHLPQGEMAMHGEFKTVEEQTLLVHTEEFDDWPDNNSEVTHTLHEKGDATLLTVLIAYESKEARDAVLRTGMDEGMEYSYGNLDALLAVLTSARQGMADANR